MPRKTREIHNHHIDSTVWNDFEFRDDDIVIATYAKSGTTLMQQIISQLLFQGVPDLPVAEMSPWVDLRTPREWRGHGGHLGDRARHRLGRGRREVPRHEGRSRRRPGMDHRRTEGVVHLRGPRKRAGGLAPDRPRREQGTKGLSLFVVPKESSREHAFECTQPTGGRLVGKADATPGYRGMHSYTLNFENWFVPNDHLVGEEAGEGRGFYLQMAGFAAGRLQTAGRATGLAQAALEETAKYVVDRKQFDQPISEFQLTQWTLGSMAAQTAGARAISYAAARAFDEDERAAGPLAAQAKLLACDVAVKTTQQGQLMHGGWGYAEEYPISRYVVDATVLPIFEGVKPILELKVIGRAILAA
jgi:hypothetical protein